jgi:nucleotide-binding universal stress UspA family protein
MFTNVVVGIDGAEGGRDATALARSLAASDARFTLAYVYPWLLGRSSGLTMDDERSRAWELLETERELAGLEADLVALADGSVGRGLHLVAERRGADLVVVGSSRRALLGRALLGDDARAALNGAPCAIAVAPRGQGHAPQPVERIGVGYDGSPESERALGVARQIAARHGAGVSVLRVVTFTDVGEHEPPLDEGWPDAVAREVTRCGEELALLEGVAGKAVYGVPREELAVFSRTLDLLVIGSRGYGPWGRLLHGSVSHALVGHCASALLVLPRSATEEAHMGQPAQTGAQTPIRA